MKKIISLFFICFTLIVALLFSWNYQGHLKMPGDDEGRVLKVLTYSGFLKTWGPGPDIAAEFEKEHHIKIHWIEVSNSGMILENLRNREAQEQPDVVLGLDLLSLQEARLNGKWKSIRTPNTNYTKELPKNVVFPEFVPIDWSPLTFIFRRTELPMPLRIDDLLKEGYANSLALQDPRTSSTGLYFLIWILSIKGEEQGFEYLKNLKPSIRIISPTWSAAYSLFQNNQAPMVFSFFTSTIYHYIKEDDTRYQPVYFDDPHVYTVEYAAIPEACTNCKDAEKFVQFMLHPSTQKSIMEKNFMLPVISGIRKGTPFDFPKTIQLVKEEKYEEILKNKQNYLERWKKLNL